jgi:hypothetical protein
MSDAKVLTFIHRFSRTLECQMRVVDCPPERECTLQCTYEWTGRPKPKHFGEYRRWVLSTTAILARRWKQRILYCLGVSSSCAELWSFEPRQSPKLVAKLPLGIL